MGPMNETETPRKRRTGRALADMFPADLPRLNNLVDTLNSSRPGKWRQRDAIRYLLDCHDQQNSEATP